MQETLINIISLKSHIQISAFRVEKQKLLKRMLICEAVMMNFNSILIQNLT